ncbi:MAG: UvrD-helicase domain-containing protein [Candidatus Margulisiibacteriota bacterium]
MTTKSTSKPFSNLNPQQEDAVKTIDGPLLIIAGAGSGKTRVLTERIKNMVINHHIAPENILAVTFTNKAAREMKERLPGKYAYPWVGTFHALCNKLLRIESDKPFVIFDAHDQAELVKKICRNMDINIQYKPSTILGAISNAKNELLTPELYARKAQTLFEENVSRVYEIYQKALSASNAFDFDDLISNAVKLLKEDERLLKKYQDKFQYISIDEYQDTNHSQYMLAKLLASKHHNICVVGDSDQNIYSWRGANIKNILSFENDYPNVKVILLEQNYRSTKTILLIANQVISKNVNRKAKNLWTENTEGEPGLIYAAYDENDEAKFLAEQVLLQKNKDDVVILYRTNAQSRAIEDAFLKRSIPYRIVGGIKFYLRKEIKDTMAYLRYLYNPEDNVALERIKKIPAFKKFEAAKVDIKPDQPPVDIINQVLNITKYRDKLEKKATDEAISRVENINELISVAQKHTNLSDFLVYTTLVTDIDELEDNTEAVTLMTLHSVKGLEYPYVYIAGVEEGLLPHYRSQMESDALEEERRLFYVGITRAKQKIVFTLAKKRLIFGETWHNEPSRFLEDVPGSLVEQNEFETIDRYSLRPQTVTPVQIYGAGDKVKHERFGNGVVSAINGDDLTIKFQDGERLLSAKYAPLERV